MLDSSCFDLAIAKPNAIIDTDLIINIWNYLSLIFKTETLYPPPLSLICHSPGSNEILSVQNMIQYFLAFLINFFFYVSLLLKQNSVESKFPKISLSIKYVFIVKRDLCGTFSEIVLARNCCPQYKL